MGKRDLAARGAVAASILALLVRVRPQAFVRLFLILPLQSIFPCALCFASWRTFEALRRYAARQGTTTTPRVVVAFLATRLGRHLVRLWLSSEVWFLAYYSWRRFRLQSQPIAPQAPITAEERLRISRRCLSTIGEMEEVEEVNGDSSLASTSPAVPLKPERMLELRRASVSGWFKGVDCSQLRRGNLRQWLAWAFFRLEPKSMTPTEKDELEIIVDEAAAWAQLDVKEEGFAENVPCIRLDFDPIPCSYRPLAFYGVTFGVVGIATELYMKWYGFQKLHSGSLTYWHRAPVLGSASSSSSASSSNRPIVFCHGLGIGVLSYATVIKELIQRVPHRRIFFVELPHISMRPVETQASADEVVCSIRHLLLGHRCAPAHFIGHSFGSLVCSWVVRLAPELVGKLTFLDPVCWLLCKHDVAYNFIYRSPRTAGELLMQWFVGRELYIAHTLARRFPWTQNIIWPEALPCPTTVVLSETDHIVPSRIVRSYLLSWDRQRNRTLQAIGENRDMQQEAPHNHPLTVEWLSECGHAGFLMRPKHFKRVMDMIV